MATYSRADCAKENTIVSTYNLSIKITTNSRINICFIYFRLLKMKEIEIPSPIMNAQFASTG